MHRFSSQLLSHAPHSGVSVGQKNEEHVNQQENKRKLLLFPVLEIKTTAVRGSTCESGICSPQVLLRIHIYTDCTRLYTASENRMMTEWGQGADLLTDSCLLAACSRTLSKDREILSQNSKPTLQGAYWSNQDVWYILGWLFISYAGGNTKLGLLTENTQPGPHLILSYFKYFLFFLSWCCTYYLHVIKQVHTRSTKYFPL